VPGKERTPQDLLTHGNIASNIVASWKWPSSPCSERGDRCLSVLPLPHIFERSGGHYTSSPDPSDESSSVDVHGHLGFAIYYAESLISLPQNLLEVRPAVPRTFEKIHAKVRDAVTSGGFSWATATCHRVVRYLDRQPPAVADRILLAKIWAKTGGNLRFCVTGGAGLNSQITDFFWACRS
jgi:long-chain acyl-CoA synthetase